MGIRSFELSWLPTERFQNCYLPTGPLLCKVGSCCPNHYPSSHQPMGPGLGLVYIFPKRNIYPFQRISPTSSVLTVSHIFGVRDWAGESWGPGVVARAQRRKNMRVWQGGDMRGRLEKAVKGWRKLLTNDWKNGITPSKVLLLGHLKTVRYSIWRLLLGTLK